MSNYKPVKQGTWNPFITYQALDTTENPVVVKRFTVIYESPGYSMDIRSSVVVMLPELRGLAEFSAGEGIAPWIRFEDTGDELHFVRPFYDARLVDRLPPQPGSMPSARLLTAFRSLAHGFDQLKKQFPSLFFFVQPDDLYLNGDSAVVANWGLDSLRNLLRKGWISHWIGGHGSLDVASCYPQAEGSHFLPRVLITPPSIPPVFALAALYVYFRTGHGPFMTAPEPAGLDQNARWKFWDAHSTVKEYRESGTVRLDHLPHEAERQIITQALIPASQVSSCTALIDELRRHYGK